MKSTGRLLPDMRIRAQRSLRHLGILATALALGHQSASAASPLDPGVVNPSSSFAGRTQYEWTADWWKTFMEAPAANNPIYPDSDATALQALNDSSRPVFYLAGTLFGPMTSDRTVTVPSNKYILFPSVNVFGQEPKLHPNSGFSSAPDNICSFIQDPNNGNYNPDLYTTTQTLDGQPLVADRAPYRQSCVGQPNSPELAALPAAGGFVVNNNPPLPDPATKPNLTQALQSAGVPGYYEPRTLDEPWNTVTDGYWFLLEPLAPGRHVITFTAALKSDPDTLFQNSTYIINSVPVPAPLPVLGAGAALAWSRRLRRRLRVSRSGQSPA